MGLQAGGEKIKKNALISFVLVLIAAGAANSATTAVSYQVSAGTDDGYAFSATGQNTINPYLIIGNGQAFNTPYYMSAMRFNNIDIPRGATIVDARLKISSRTTDYRGQIYGVIYAEATDNASNFNSRMIASANLTTASVDWDHKDAWSVNTFYTSGDVSSVVQEVVNRSGWKNGNSIAIHYRTRADSNKLRGFASYEYNPTSAAVLEITYETYSISGHVLTSDGRSINGVIVSAGGDIKETTVDVTGYYELLVPSGWSGTVAVSKSGWIFQPVSRTYANVTSDFMDEDYQIEPVGTFDITYQISASADDGCTDSDTWQDTTSANMLVAFYEPCSPWTTGLRFIDIEIPQPTLIRSAKLQVCAIGNDYLPVLSSIYGEPVGDAVDFSSRNIMTIPSTETVIDWDITSTWQNNVWYDSVDISGIIQEIVDQSGWSSGNAMVLLWTGREFPGSRSELQITAYDHIYRPGKAAKLHVVFDYARIISGNIEYDNGTPAVGIHVVTDNNGGSGITDSDGHFELRVPYNWSGTLTPSKTAWGFSPASRAYTNVTADQTNQDYSAFQPKISGHIMDINGVAAENVRIIISNSEEIITTDANGYYNVTVDYDWSGILKPFKGGWELEPSGREYFYITSDQDNQDYTITVFTGIINVSKDTSGDIMDIQSAIDAAADGFTIIVSPGTYYENIAFKGRNILLTSIDSNSSSSSNTIIHGAGSGTVVTFTGSESPECVLRGFTITGGSRGINGQGAHATIEGCVIKENHGSGGLYRCYGLVTNCNIRYNSRGSNESGGGLYWCNEITNCVIRGNSVGSRGYGGGLAFCNGIIKNCLIIYNKTGVLGSGGAIGISSADIINCTIVENYNSYSYTCGGLYGCHGEIVNCIIWDNEGSQLDQSSTPLFSYLNDPLFVPGSFNLSADSPCIDNGDPNYIQDINETDINGQPRVINGRIDIGADEYFFGELSDFNGNGIVNFEDFTILAYYWKDYVCEEPNWCEGCDYNQSSRVDANDLMRFAEHWLWQASWYEE